MSLSNGSVRAFVRQNWLMLAVFSVSLCVALWFAVGFVLDVIYFNDPRHQDEALKAWMTPRYVVMSYDLPRDVVAKVLALPEGGPGRLKLDEIAENLGVTLGELTTRVRDAAERYREGQS